MERIRKNIIRLEIAGFLLLSIISGLIIVTPVSADNSRIGLVRDSSQPLVADNYIPFNVYNADGTLATLNGFDYSTTSITDNGNGTFAYTEKWLVSYATLQFDTDDGDLDTNDYAFDGTGTGYYIQPNDNGQYQFIHVGLNWEDASGKFYSIVGDTLVSIVDGETEYYNVFLTAQGAKDDWTVGSRYYGADFSTLPAGDVVRVQSTEDAYTALETNTSAPVIITKGKISQSTTYSIGTPDVVGTVNYSVNDNNQPVRSEVTATSAIPAEPIGLPNGDGIGFDATSNSGDLGATSSYSWSHTCGASANFLIFGESHYWGIDATVSTVTYNGVGMTHASGADEVFFESPYYLRSTIFYLYAPATGSAYTVSVTFSSTQNGRGGVCSYSGVKQSGQPDAIATNYGNSGSPTLNITTVADNCWVFAVAYANNTAGTTCNNTSRWSISYGRFVGSDTNGVVHPAGSQTMSWTATPDWFVISAVSFAPLVTANVTTQTSSSILNWTFTGNGNITNTGSSAVTVRGICYSTTSNPPTTTDSKVQETGAGFSTGAYTEAITGLTEGTTYYVRAFATNTQGTAYGSTVTTVTNADVYWVGDTGTTSNATAHWAQTSGGTPAVGNSPTATLNAHFDANSFSTTGLTVTEDATFTAKSIDWTGALHSPTFTGSQTTNIYGSLTFISAMTETLSGAVNFKATSGTNTVTSGGKIITSGIISFDGVGGTWTLQDTLNSPSATIYIVNGLLNTNSQTVVVSTFGDNGSTSTRSLILGGSSISCVTWSLVPTGMTLTPNTSNINMTSATTFAGGGLTYNTVTFSGAGSSAVTITGSNTFNPLVVDRSQSAKTLTFTAGTTQTMSDFVCTVNGSVIVTLGSSAASVFNLIMTGGSSITATDYLVLSYSNASPATLTWFAGANSINNGNNTGWIFAVNSLPSVLTNSVPSSTITSNSAILQGTLSSLGIYTPVYVSFNYGLTTAYELGSTPEQPYLLQSSFVAHLSSLTPGTTYHYQAVVRYGTNLFVTDGDQTFTTLTVQSIPVVTQPYAPTAGNGGTGDPNTIPTLQQPTTWWANGGSMTGLPFYADFDDAATGMNPNNPNVSEGGTTPNGQPHPTTMVLYLMAIMATAMAAGYGVILFTGSSLLALGVIAITMGVGASMTIISGWMVFLILIGGGGLWMLAKYI